MDNNFNRVQLCGTVDSAPALSHVNHGVSFYKFTLAVERLSGLADKLTVIAAQPLLESAAIREGDTVTVRGQLRSFNNKVEGCKPKDMIGIPWMLAFALRDTGWYLRNDIIWMKDNPMPESVKDRCARCYEHIFLFSKSKKYFFDYKAISEPIAPATAERLKRGMKGGNKYGKPVPGQPQPQSINRPREHGEIKDCDIDPLRNKRDVWKINTVPFKGGHYAAYPPKLVETCLLAGCPEGGIVLDPFMGSGTTGMVASQMGRHFVGIELNPEYTELAYKRIGGEI